MIKTLTSINEEKSPKKHKEISDPEDISPYSNKSPPSVFNLLSSNECKNDNIPSMNKEIVTKSSIHFPGSSFTTIHFEIIKTSIQTIQPKSHFDGGREENIR